MTASPFDASRPGATRSRQEEERRTFDRLVRRLGERYPTVAPDVVATTVETERRRLDGSRVRDFLPLLVERAARTRLHQHAVSPPSGG